MPAMTVGRLVRVIIIVLVGPTALSLWGPIYFGIRHVPYLSVVIWAAICTAYLLWWLGESFRPVFNRQPDTSLRFHLSLVIATIVIVGGGFLGAQSLVYFLVERISN
jgi:hypothetical protein